MNDSVPIFVLLIRGRCFTRRCRPFAELRVSSKLSYTGYLERAQ